MSPREFWEMSPVAFELKTEGYLAQQNRSRVYFREMFALLFNVNRGEKTPAMSGAEAMPLLGERAKRQPRGAKPTVWTPEEMSRVTHKMNGWAYPPDKQQVAAVANAIQGLKDAGVTDIPPRKEGEPLPDYEARLRSPREDKPIKPEVNQPGEAVKLAWRQLQEAGYRAGIPMRGTNEDDATYAERLNEIASSYQQSNDTLP